MAEEYSIYDAKAHLSALVRQVREGSTFIITVHGEPVAELRPIPKPEPRRQTLEERIAELTARGQISAPERPAGVKPFFPLGDPLPGALQRFLDERD